MSLLSVLGAPFKEIADGVKSIVGAFVEDPGKKHELEVAVDQLVHSQQMKMEDRLIKELEAKERIMVAELQQDDNYTKRARPTVIYAGVVMALFEATMKAIAFLGIIHTAFEGTIVPEWFYGAWAMYGSVYAIGRSAEKRAQQNGKEPSRLVKLVTGG